MSATPTARRNLEALTAHLRCPREHWRRIRHTNLLERTFGESRRRVKVIGRLKKPLFSPSEPWEKKGDVNNVVFPTGAVVQEGRLTLYYGAADKLIAAKSVDLEELVSELKNNP